MPDNNDEFSAQWRRFESAARRGFDRLTGMADTDGFGNNFRMGRMLAAGDVRLVALYLIDQQPRHGYDLIKAIEEKSRGFYSPSPGMIYPALTYLEEAGFVTAEYDANKKLYTITEAGRSHLTNNRAAIEATLNFLAKAGERMQQFRDWSFGNADADGSAERHSSSQRHGPGPRSHRHGFPFGGPNDRDIEDVLPEVNDARRALKDAIRAAIGKGEDVQRKTADILRRAATDIARQTGDDIDL